MDQLTKPHRRIVMKAAEVGVSRVHESAHLHVSGRADYTDDLPELAGTVHVALGLSPSAHATIESIDLDAVRAMPGVIAVFTAADIPGVNDCGPIIQDDPILAEGTVQYLGQPVFAVAAVTRNQARRAAAMAREVVKLSLLPAVLTAREAHALGRYVMPPMALSRGNPAEMLEKAEHRLTGKLSVGGQEQFYLEGQIAYAVPLDDGGIKVNASTQHPTEMQHMVAHSLGIPSNKVHIECRRAGGGFGGKETQSGLHCCIASVVATRLRRPAKLRLDRDDDFMVTGRRHGFEYDFDVGFDDDGRILAADITMISNAGFSADLSSAVMTRAICHFDNAYWLPNVSMRGYCAKTNTQSNTAFRGFGGPQGAIAIEAIIDKIAHVVGRDPVEIRQANFYGTTENNITPYRQPVKDNIIRPLTDELLESCKYRERRKAIDAFNQTSPILKKGMALAPVKFGVAFNIVHFNQAGALVHIYTDGSVLVNHGGIEMGQGLNTKVCQVVAEELGVTIARVRATATDTQKIPNTAPTAASTGADLNGKAAQDAARKIRERLAALAAATYGGEACDVVFSRDEVHVNGQVVGFPDLVMQAYMARVQLWSDGFYSTPDLSWDRETMTGTPFYYFAYGASVSEVIIDILTGECALLQTDILHDAGRSLNPALDIGQVEGAFVQGAGWLTNEELVWHPQTGALLTHAPSTYKIPTANDVPAAFTTRLHHSENAVDSIFRSKAVGEPPLLHGFSVWLAISDAISAIGGHKYAPELRAPATAEAILEAAAGIKARMRET